MELEEFCFIIQNLFYFYKILKRVFLKFGKEIESSLCLIFFVMFIYYCTDFICVREALLNYPLTVWLKTFVTHGMP